MNKYLKYNYIIRKPFGKFLFSLYVCTHMAYFSDPVIFCPFFFFFSNPQDIVEAYSLVGEKKRDKCSQIN